MEILLLRHGQTTGNAQGRYIGRTDVDVTPVGLEELKTMGEDTSVQKVYVTPLKRTHQTAALFFPQAEQVIVPGLHEMDFGNFEDRDPEELEQDPEFQAWKAEGAVGSCPGGDTLEGFVARIQECFCTLVEEAMARGEERLVIVGHGGVFMALMASFAHDGRELYGWFAPNGGGWRARVDAESWSMEKKLLDVRPVLGPLE